MSDFGDFENDDAFDASGIVDPEQVAIKLDKLYAANGQHEHGTVARLLIAWLIRQGGLR